MRGGILTDSCLRLGYADGGGSNVGTLSFGHDWEAIVLYSYVGMWLW